MPTGLSVPYATPWEIYAASVVLPFLGSVFVLLRFYVRTLQKKSTGVDDWLMLPALILVIGMGISLIIGVHKKAVAYPTPYNEDLTLEEQYEFVDPTIELMNKLQYAFIILMVLAFGIIKLSITFYYRRIFVTARGSLFDWVTKVAISIVLLWTIGCLFAFIFSCGIHISAYWGSIQDYITYCGPSDYVSNAFVVSDLITDVMVLCLPLPVIWKLQMTIGRKMIVTGVLATGAVSVVASIIKVIVSFEITNAGPDADFDGDLVVSTILYWSMIEGGLAVIAACLPTLRFLIRNVSPPSFIHSLLDALSFGSVDTQQRKRYQQSPARSKESYTYIHAGSSTSSTSDAAREKNNNLIDNSVRGNVDRQNRHLDPQGHDIQVTRHFSQHASMV